jgi:hypothetical protein
VSPHSHRNMWKVRPTVRSNMLVTKRGCLPHRVQGGQIGLCDFSINEQSGNLDHGASKNQLRTFGVKHGQYA